MKILLVTVLFLAIYATSASAGGENESTIKGEYCYAVLKADKAAFIFPIIEDEQWVWFRRETADNALEYSWEVILPGQKQSLNLGAFLFKYPGEKQRTGTLPQLITAAQWTVFDNQTTPDGGTTSKLLEEMKIIVKVIDDAVVVGITDKATLSKAFAERPEKAQFVIRTPFDEPFTCTTSIEYPKE